MTVKAKIVWLLALLSCLLTQVWGRLGAADGDDPTERFLRDLTEDKDGHVHVIIGLKKDGILDDVKRSIHHDSAVDSDETKGKGLKRIHATSAKLTKKEIKKLLKRGDIEYIEEDFDVYLDSNSEVIPYGVTLSQSLDPGTAAYKSFSNSTLGACNDESSFKVAIIDSGAFVAHPDLPCRDIEAEDTNCIGMEFGVEGETWYTGANPHGTHVFGIIGALRNNQHGIVGQVTEPNVCYILAQIFGADGTSKNSAVIDAVDWAIENGASIINMSLGSPTRSISAEQYFALIRSQGILVVSAAGNDGSTNFHYPGSYDSVISVASVDASLQRSEFSQYNNMVDLAAPGSAILSTFPANMTNAAILKGPNNAYSASMMSGSSPPDSDGISGPIVFCSDYGQDACEGPGGHICLVQRGATSFEVKAANCEASGGIGVIIYNNIPNITLIGSLSESVGIPVLGMSAEDATSLYTESVGRSVFVEAMEGFALMDGTSMATPFVTGALAEIWRHCPLCSADEVESCLLSTTLPLEGNEYDYGFLQTRSAFACLANQTGCCDGTDLVDDSLVPSASPTSLER